MSFDWREHVTKIANGWAGYSAVGTFALYVCGYLALRFHLTVLGVGTDLAVIDERYLFAGARFLTLTLVALPSIALFIVPIAFVASLLSQTAVWKNTLHRWISQHTSPAGVAVAGCVVAIISIQFAMRRCFFLSNLLFHNPDPNPPWVTSLFMAGDEMRGLFFVALVALTLLTASFLWWCRIVETRVARGGAWATALTVFLIIQVALLPVNYGCLVMDKSLPRVKAPVAIQADETVWLAWEGSGGKTFFVRGANPESRRLITISEKMINRTEITGYDGLETIVVRGNAAGGSAAGNSIPSQRR